MQIKVIRNDEEHREAITRLDELMILDPAPETPEDEELRLLALVIDDYEKDRWPVDPVSPIDAISFRMEQMGLKQKDLVPYIGSAGKVSEVLSGKRSLTTDMIRALHARLEIPLHSLVMEEPSSYQTDMSKDPDNYPLKEMKKRGWIDIPRKASREITRKILQDFLAPLQAQPTGALARKTQHVRAGKASDPYALEAWTAAVLRKGTTVDVNAGFPWKELDTTFLGKVVRLSSREDGISQVARVLGEHGIRFTVLEHLPRTYLDGATIIPEGESPIVCLTLRHDRVDNFWFTLVHELAHVVLHHGKGLSVFYDNLEVTDNIDVLEKEADEAAGEALVPRWAWERSGLQSSHSTRAVELLAEEIGVAPEVVAGKVRRETGKYNILTSLVGKGEARKFFDRENFPE